MTIKELPSVEFLRERYSYNPETGELISKWAGRAVGKKMRFRGKPAALYVRFFHEGKYKSFPVHRLAMVLMDVPLKTTDYIDHIDTNPLNNRWENLRLCNNQQNKRNGKKYHRVFGPQLPKGVVRCGNRWRATIKFDKTVHLGVFDTIDAAAEAFRVAASKYHGEFFRAG